MFEYNLTLSWWKKSEMLRIKNRKKIRNVENQKNWKKKGNRKKLKLITFWQWNKAWCATNRCGHCLAGAFEIAAHLFQGSHILLFTLNHNFDDLEITWHRQTNRHTNCQIIKKLQFPHCEFSSFLVSWPFIVSKGSFAYYQ